MAVTGYVRLPHGRPTAESGALTWEVPVAAMNAAQQTVVIAEFTAWRTLTWPTGTSTGADFLAKLDQLRRYALKGVFVGAKYDTQLRPVVDTMSLTTAQRHAVRQHAIGG